MNKEQILAEIKRTAGENDGVALGRQRFFQATGIKESDWQGKVWVRWGDAVREAGFSPNALQAAYTDEALLERYAGLVLDLGHVPVANELKLHAKTNPDFPSHNTFARFGTKRQLLSKLHDFARARDELAPVAKLCEPAVVAEPLDQLPVVKGEDAIGFVYLIKAGRHYKIGKTNAVGRRERELAIQLPEKSQTVHAIRTDDPSGIEAYWHRRFEAKRKNGEWFELTAQDVMVFRRRKFM